MEPELILSLINTAVIEHNSLPGKPAWTIPDKRKREDRKTKKARKAGDRSRKINRKK